MIFKSIFRKKLSSGKEKFTLFTDRDILRLVIPLFFEQLLFILVGSADTLMVAGLGEASISAVSLVNMFNNCICSIIFALSTGGAVVASQFLGARNFTRANESAKQLIAIVLTAGLLLFAVGELFLEEIVQLIYGELAPDVYKDLLSYFRIILITIPFVAVYGGCAALFRAMNRTKMTMYISFISNVINITGNALLIYWLCMGVSGAALATLISYLVVFLIRSVNTRRHLPFRQYPWQVAFNTLVVGVQALAIIRRVEGWIWIQVGAIALIFFVNAKPLITMVLHRLRSRRKKA